MTSECPFPSSRCRFPIVALSLAAVMASVVNGFGAQEAERKDVLILYGLQSHMPIVLDWDRGLRTAIESGLDEPVRIEAEYLDLLRSQNKEYLDQWMALLRRKYQDNDPDVVIAVFDPSLKFVLDHRDRLFPNVPVVFCSAHFYRTSGVQLPPDLTGVTYDLSYAETLELAVRMRPGTRKVAVVAGSSDFGSLMLTEARSVFAEHAEFEFTYLAGLSVEQLLTEVARLPEDAIVLYPVYVRDPQGRHHHANDVLSRVSAKASVPTFALWDTNLGSGTVGGHMVRIEQQAIAAGEVAVRVMHGEDPASIPIAGRDSNQLVLDWRALRRWKMNGNRLPAESLVLYREMSLWEEYGKYIFVVAATIAFQAALIFGLLVNRVRRRRAERSLTNSREEARRLAGRLITAQEDERKRLAREMHDDLSQRLAATAIEAGKLAGELDVAESARSALNNIEEELGALAEDVHRISRQLHPSILDDLGLEDALRSECEAVAEREAIQVDFDSRDVPRSIPTAVALCVYRVTQEALRNASKHAATDRIAVAVVADDEFLYLTVQDHGKGFELPEIARRPGLGLASIGERVRLVEGTLRVNTQLGSGTTIEVRVPLLEG